LNEPVPGIELLLQGLTATLEGSIFPLVKAMDGKIDLDLKTHHKMSAISEQLRDLEENVLNMKHVSRNTADQAEGGQEEH
jgi:hypothetical protein